MIQFCFELVLEFRPLEAILQLRAVSFFSHSDPYESPSSTFAARPSLSLFARDSIPSLAAALTASPSPIPPCLLGLMVEGRGLPSVEGYSRSPSTAPASEDQAAAIEPNQADKLS